MADVLPAKIVTDTGGLATLELLERITFAPPVGAAGEIVNVPVELLPPVTEVGFNVNPVIAGGFTVSVPLTVMPLDVPVTVTVVGVATPNVLAVKVAEVCPEGIVTEAGTVTVVALLERVTTVPPDGAGAFKLTVPVDVEVPITVLGLNVSEERPTGARVRMAF